MSPEERPAASGAPRPLPELLQGPLQGPGSGSGPFRTRLRGVLILAALALLGFALSRLRDAGRPVFDTLSFLGPKGEAILVVERREGGPPFGAGPEVRLVLSRRPIDFDAERSLIRVEGRGPQVAPPGWPAILVDSRGELRRRDLDLDSRRARGFFSPPGRPGPLSFSEVQRALNLLDPALAAFWQAEGN
jgi:hypothetical protein